MACNDAYLRILPFCNRIGTRSPAEQCRGFYWKSQLSFRNITERLRRRPIRKRCQRSRRRRNWIQSYCNRISHCHLSCSEVRKRHCYWSESINIPSGGPFLHRPHCSGLCEGKIRAPEHSNKRAERYLSNRMGDAFLHISSLRGLPHIGRRRLGAWQVPYRRVIRVRLGNSLSCIWRVCRHTSSLVLQFLCHSV